MRIADLVFFSVVLISLYSCGQNPPVEDQDYLVVEGKTMGTYYRVVYDDTLKRDLSHPVEKLLEEINFEVSTYIDSSIISRFNHSVEGIDLGGNEGAGENSAHFQANLAACREAFEKSGGAFDPTVMPLVNYWGFGYTGKNPVLKVDSLKIDSLLAFIGFDKVELAVQEDRLLIKKKLPGVELDFGGCAQGYAIDEIGRYLESLNIKNYLVDIGGEARGRGRNPQGEPWKIGINRPVEGVGKTDIETVIPLDNLSVSTSGNYQNFYEVDGVKYSHTINPFTGFPERSRLLSASVFSKDCTAADTYATAFMVMGLEKARKLAETLPGIEGFFIYSGPDGELLETYTSGLKSWFKEPK